MGELICYRGIWIPSLEAFDEDFREFIQPYKNRLLEAERKWLKNLGNVGELSKALEAYNRACEEYIDQHYDRISKDPRVLGCLPF